MDMNDEERPSPVVPIAMLCGAVALGVIGYLLVKVILSLIW